MWYVCVHMHVCAVCTCCVRAVCSAVYVHVCARVCVCRHLCGHGVCAVWYVCVHMYSEKIGYMD